MITEIIEKTMPILAKKRTELELGDRSAYIGASDIAAACIRKTVLSKLKPVEYDTSTLIKFERGHLTETILIKCFDEYGKYKYVAQKEAVHSNNSKWKCHIDFMFHNKSRTKIGIVECKSTNGIPDEPYESWVNQVQFQMGLLKLNYPNSVIKGSIFAIDLNAGKMKEFNGYEPNYALFNALCKKATTIQALIETHETADLETSESMLCGFCPFKTDCPKFSGEENVVPDDLKAAVKQYKEVQEQQKALKQKLDMMKENILAFTGDDYHAAWDGNKVTVSTVKSNRIDAKTLKSEYPDIFSNALKTSESVRLRIS